MCYRNTAQLRLIFPLRPPRGRRRRGRRRVRGDPGSIGRADQLRPERPGPNPSDVNGDGFRGIEDLSAVLGNWNAGRTTSTDPDITYPTPASARVTQHGVECAGPALCEVGHQGLFHDDEFGSRGGLVYNRARMRSSRLGRWLQREPLDYIDSMNLYQYVNSHPVDRLDPTGLWEQGQRYARQRRLDHLATFRPNAWLWDNGYSRRWDAKLRDLAKAAREAIPAHSDFPGGDEFDYAKEDDGWTSPFNPLSTGNHFRQLPDVEHDLTAAMNSCDKDKFERLMHQGQDTFSHSDAGWSYNPLMGEWGHVFSLSGAGGSHRPGHAPDDSTSQTLAYERARRWTQEQVDKWHLTCKIDCDGKGKPKRYAGD